MSPTTLLSLSLLSLLSLSLSLSPSPSASTHVATAYFNASTQKLSVEIGVFDVKSENSIAVAKFEDTVEETGWGVFRVETLERPNIPGSILSYSSGLLEGALTVPRVYESYVANIYMVFGNGTYLPTEKRPMKLLEWLQENWLYMERMVEENRSSRFWSSVSLLLDQFRGLSDGYNLAAAINPATPPTPSTSTPPEILHHISPDDPSVIISRMDPKGVQVKGPVEYFESFGGRVEVLDEFAFWLMVGQDDVTDLLEALYESPPAAVGAGRTSRLSLHDIPRLSPKEIEEQRSERMMKQNQRVSHPKRIPYPNLHEKCSALVKLSTNYSNIYFAHSTWYSFASMNRIYKHYNHRHIEGGVEFSMSSYPGFLISSDDFYMLYHTNLTVTETSNDIFNRTLWDLISTKSLLNWVRVSAANYLATSGKEWCELFSENHSGTYNNQYMILDMKRFTPYEPLKSGLLYVIEEIPGKTEYIDATAYIDEGASMWPSYNVPYFKDIWNVSGYPAMVSEYGTYYTHSLAPRSQLFRKYSSPIDSLSAMKRVMRLNRPSDPIQGGNTAWAICSRLDLVEDVKHRHAAGCVDSKVTSYRMFTEERLAVAISGPTVGDPDDPLPPFSFTGEWEHVYHRGLATTYNFDWVDMRYEHNISPSS